MKTNQIYLILAATLLVAANAVEEDKSQKE